ncbi:MAG: hypothetical protein KF773_28515 [Deltaproteobacteria bacterium]|nr:hypothetical protein [Deltaproteobacteria bacterium]MCW5801852.1 hypothetical protein [Deltaproteobacteria bacterium]
MRLHTLLLAGLAIATLTACPKGGVPGTGGLSKIKDKADDAKAASGDGPVDANGCGGFASAGDAGRKLKLFLQATQDLEKATTETVDVVKQSCIIMGNELGMTDADYKGETKDICATVYGRITDGMKVAFKAQAGIKIKVTPAVCRVDAQAQAQAAAQCEAKASADMKVSCTGVCHGKCDGTCEGGNAGGKCDGKCSGTCNGQCEGSADVNASAQCRASASVKASVEVQCTEPSVDIQTDAKLVVDKTKAEQTIKALKAGLPKILSVKSRLVPLASAVKNWVASAQELKSAGASLANQFKDQALCVTGQIAAAAKAVGKIEANVSVSVSVSASASGSFGGG